MQRTLSWAAAAWLLAAPAWAQESASFAITDVRIFDGERVLPKATVLVRDGRIAAVGPTVKVPPGTEIIKAEGRTLLPGLIDAHVHSFGSSRMDAPRFGVTVELDMFTDWHSLPEFQRDRELIGNSTHSDVYSAGTLVTVAKGHGTEYGLAIPTLERTQDAAQFVDDRIAEGSDFIKLVMDNGSLFGGNNPTLPDESVRAVIGAAKSRNKLAVVHVSSERDAMFALQAGADGLVHVFQDRPASDEFVALAVDKGAFVVPTLSVIDQSSSASGPQLADDERFKPWLQFDQRSTLRGVFPRRSNSDELRANARQSVRKLAAAGVPILAGTDAGNPGTAHGVSIHGEMALLVGAGLTPLQALAAATRVPAQIFRLPQRGRIASGQRADLVLVEGDPTRDIDATRAIVDIWKNGRKVDRTVVLPKSRPAPPIELLSDFDGGKPSAAYGLGWEVSTDDLIGGSSSAAMNVVSSGVKGNGKVKGGPKGGALEIIGEIRPGAAAYPWGGAMCFLGDGRNELLDFTGRSEIVFWAKGDRDAVVMLYSGASRFPSILPFGASNEWREYRMPLSSFRDAELRQVRAVMFAATNPPGRFRLLIDQVQIR